MTAQAQEPPTGGDHHDPSTWPTARLLGLAAHLAMQALDHAIALQGLTHSQLFALHCLIGGPLPQHEIALSLHVTDQTVSRLVDGLERHGLVERTRDAADRRRQLVAMTGQGARAHAAGVQIDALQALDSVTEERLRDALLLVVPMLQQAVSGSSGLGSPD